MLLQNVEAFIFDFDGTLADTESVHFFAFNQTFGPSGGPLAVSEFREYIGREKHAVFEQIKQRHRIDFDEEEACKSKTEAFLRLSQEYDLRCFGYFAELREAYPHIPAYLVSTQELALIEEMLERWKLQHLFEAVITTADNRTKKQHIEMLCQEHNFNLGQVAYFEDALHNIKMGNDLGLITVWINNRLNDPLPDCASPPRVVIDVKDECFDLTSFRG